MVGIEIKNVSKRFGGTAAVDRVSLEVKRGELFFLLGPSGCGKTTLLRMIAGFCDPEEGDICFDAASILKVPANRRNTALVFQNYALWPHMTVAENVAYGLEERRTPKARRLELVNQALRGVRMEEYARRMPNQLSGGQQQRVALARALVITPDAVLLDEPLSNLDAKLRLEMRGEIRRIHEETGITMVYVTHDQKEALSMADRIAVMSMGRVEQVGDPRSIYRTPVNRFVAEFIGEANFIMGELAAIDGEFGIVRSALGEFRARLRPGSALAGAPVECMVRPESLRVADKGAGNSFSARVASSMYLGESEEFTLETRENTRVKAMSANPRSGAMPPGMEVEVSFDAGDAVILPCAAQ